MPLQIWAGHWSGEIVHHHQPAKLAALEGWWTTQSPQPSILFAIPDEARERNIAEIAIPGLGDIVVGGKGPLLGLDAFPREDRPPVFLTFWGFRIMVGAGLGMLALGLWGCALWRLGRLDRPGLFHWLAVPGGALGFIAVVSGWIVAEVGRQPFTVYGALRTAESVSPVAAGQVAFSLLVFMIVYAIVFTAGVVYMARIALRGFDDTPAPPPESARRAPGSPLGAVDEPAELAPAPAE
jgi:cytochrome d ubiquinol oxidase subunit I